MVDLHAAPRPLLAQDPAKTWTSLRGAGQERDDVICAPIIVVGFWVCA